MSIKIEAWDRTGLLRDIAAVIAESKINLSGADVQVYDDKTAVISTIVEIQNLSQLSRLLERLVGARRAHGRPGHGLNVRRPAPEVDRAISWTDS